MQYKLKALVAALVAVSIFSLGLGYSPSADAEVKVAAVQAAAAAASTQDFTDSDAGFSSDVQAAIFLSGTATANGTATAGGKFNLGFAARTGGNTDATMSYAATDALATTSSVDQLWLDQAYMFQSVGTGSTGEATVNSWLSNGVRLDWNDQSSAELVSAILIGGDVEARVVVADFTNATAPETVTVSHGLSGAPEVIIAMSNFTANNPGNSGAASKLSLGFWTGGAYSAVGWLDGTSLANGSNASNLFTDGILGRIQGAANANIDIKITIANVDSDSFDAVASAATSAYTVFLVLRGTTSPIVAKTGQFTTPTSPAQEAEITGMSLSPTVLFTIPSLMTGGSSSTGDPAGVFGLNVSVKNAGSSSTTCSDQVAGIQCGGVITSGDDGAADSDVNHQTTISRSLVVLDNTGARDVEAKIYSLDSGGITLDYSNVAASALTIPYLAFGQSASAPTFTENPAIGTRTTSSIPVTGKSACTDCTFHGVAVADAGSATCSQIDGETVTGAYKYFHVSMTANVQATGTFSSYTDGTVRDLKFCLESATNGYSAAVESINDAYKIPAFTDSPTVSPLTGGFQINKTLDGAGTVYAVACKPGDTPATVAQVKAGDCTGNVDALANASDDASGAFNLGSSLDNPMYSVYIVGTYGGQDEAAVHAFEDEFKSPASGRQYQQLASVSATSFCNGISSPAVAADDVVEGPTGSTPDNFPTTIFNDCDFEYTGGDETRQHWCFRVYDYTVGSFMSGGGGPCGAGYVTVVANNESPVCPDPEDVVVNVGASNSVDLKCPDAENDTITYTYTGTVPSGMTYSTAGVLSGNPSVENESGTIITITATDIYGATDTWDVTIYPIDTVTVPNCRSPTLLTIGECFGELSEVFLSPGSSSQLHCDPGTPAGYVYSQSLTAGSEVEPGTIMDLVTSRGRCRRRPINTVH